MRLFRFKRGYQQAGMCGDQDDEQSGNQALCGRVQELGVFRLENMIEIFEGLSHGRWNKPVFCVSLERWFPT